MKKLLCTISWLFACWHSILVLQFHIMTAIKLRLSRRSWYNFRRSQKYSKQGAYIHFHTALRLFHILPGMFVFVSITFPISAAAAPFHCLTLTTTAVIVITFSNWYYCCRVRHCTNKPPPQTVVCNGKWTMMVLCSLSRSSLTWNFSRDKL